jgi:hypothetical protein
MVIYGDFQRTTMITVRGSQPAQISLLTRSLPIKVVP